MTKLSDLISQGLIKPDEKIFMKKKGKIFLAEILGDGSILSEDGKIFKSPSGAARANNDGKPIDGWTKWRLDSNESVTLDELRKKIQSVN